MGREKPWLSGLGAQPGFNISSHLTTHISHWWCQTGHPAICSHEPVKSHFTNLQHIFVMKQCMMLEGYIFTT